jgi:4-hydroxy-tetrahydrodipicolinate synthase
MNIGIHMPKGGFMNTGCYTAMVTPFTGENCALDSEGLEQLAEFQIQNGITGLLAVGTTGESPTLSEAEHHRVVEIIAAKAKDRCLCVAGTGSNNTKDSMAATAHAAKIGVDAVLLVDPYYNGPSSMEIRLEYVAPVAERFPDLTIIPYVIPGRTGAQLLPEDIALLNRTYKNVSTVKEATGNLENMRRTRECCGEDFIILSGDDGMTVDMMTDPQINAAGVISVISNIAPGPITRMVRRLAEGDRDGALELKTALEPLFGLVTVSTKEKTPFGEVVFRARNPLAIKTLMAILGLPGGACRQPLGKMTLNGINQVLDVARGVQDRHPEIFAPLADFFNIDVAQRLNQPEKLDALVYGSDA